MDNKVEVGSFLKDAYSKFGQHVNTQRATAQIYDGCKPVTRRVLYASYLLGNKFMKSATITGKTIGEFHPHGSDSVYTTVVSLVRSGIFQGQGQFGSSSMLPDGATGAAAPRYTEAKLKDSFYEFIDMLIKFVPFVDSEIDGYRMPEYLPTPLPISLITGTFGIGFGMNVIMPAFTPQSLLAAYLTNDPNKLKMPYDLLIDYKNSQFKELWETGSGSIICALHVNQGYSLDGATYGTIISGDPDLFKPTITEELQSMIDQGKVRVRDESGPSGQRLFIFREKRVSVIDDNWIFEQCKLGSVRSINYRINVAAGTKVGKLGLKDWIDFTYNNYINILKSYIESKIKDFEWKLTLLEYADRVMESFQKSGMTLSNEEIAKDAKIDDINIVIDIMKSSLSSWRRMDKDAKKAKYTEQLKYWKSVDPDKLVIELINKL